MYLAAALCLLLCGCGKKDAAEAQAVQQRYAALTGAVAEAEIVSHPEGETRSFTVRCTCDRTKDTATTTVMAPEELAGLSATVTGEKLLIQYDGPALAAGNSVVLKPSEKSPLSAIRLAGLAKEAGLPDGVLNVVTGFGHEAGQALSRHNDIDVIAFTGSTRTGKQLLKDAGDSNMKRVWLEAGGKSANIVFADCPDLQKAASATAAGIFYNQGQVCIAGTRLLLEESIADEFLALLKQQAQNWQPGHPLDPATTMGTLIDCAHADSVHSFIREGESKGQLLLDGRNAELAAAIGPTIFVDVDPNASLSREEIFGPVLVVTRFKSEDQALQLANDSQYGLGAAVWTRDLSRAHRMSRRLKAGSVFVNNYNDGDMTVPFGGYKQSGNGRDKSLHALEKFTELKTIWISLEA